MALDFDNKGIDFSVEIRADYLRFRFLCLNEDFKKAVELVADLVKNSTFDEFDKEIIKLEG
ncbi:insulinase family protein, partial [bacterium]|nr:insulinase family protein [bacterium]